jgi:hypothetical protein
MGLTITEVLPRKNGYRELELFGRCCRFFQTPPPINSLKGWSYQKTLREIIVALSVYNSMACFLFTNS